MSECLVNPLFFHKNMILDAKKILIAYCDGISERITISKSLDYFKCLVNFDPQLSYEHNGVCFIKVSTQTMIDLIEVEKGDVIDHVQYYTMEIPNYHNYEYLDRIKLLQLALIKGDDELMKNVFKDITSDEIKYIVNNELEMKVTFNRVLMIKLKTPRCCNYSRKWVEVGKCSAVKSCCVSKMAGLGHRFQDKLEELRNRAEIYSQDKKFRDVLNVYLDNYTLKSTIKSGEINHTLTVGNDIFTGTNYDIFAVTSHLMFDKYTVNNDIFMDKS